MKTLLRIRNYPSRGRTQEHMKQHNLSSPEMMFILQATSNKHLFRISKIQIFPNIAWELFLLLVLQNCVLSVTYSECGCTEKIELASCCRCTDVRKVYSTYKEVDRLASTGASNHEQMETKLYITTVNMGAAEDTH